MTRGFNKLHPAARNRSHNRFDRLRQKHFQAGSKQPLLSSWQDCEPRHVGGSWFCILTPPFVFGAKLQMRLQAAANLLKCYDTVGSDVTPGNTQWDPIIKNFAQQWKVPKDCSKSDLPKTPKLTKVLPVVKWTEVFVDHCGRVPELHHMPLSHVI